MEYRLEPHTADVVAWCRGRDFAELVEAAAYALYAVTLTVPRTEHALQRHVALPPADSPEEALAHVLRELIYLLDVQHFAASHFEVTLHADGALTLDLEGYEVPPDERETEVKAATRHGLEIRQDETGWEARVLFDL